MSPTTPTALGLAAALVIMLPACAADLLDPDGPGVLVPPTAAQDPSLPGLGVTVEGHERRLHLEAFGDPGDPVALVLPGGPGADYRLLLPLRELSERYRVVLWDARGAGLSER